MLSIEILAVGKFKKAGHFQSLWNDYAKQLKWPLKLVELEAPNTAEEHKLILSKLSDQSTIFVMDERGKSYGSRAFAAEIEKLEDNGVPLLQFVLGGADGLSDDIRQRGHKIVSFGVQTWPHMLARVMLIEQIYRAQQILKGHPYHRD